PRAVIQPHRNGVQLIGIETSQFSILAVDHDRSFTQRNRRNSGMMRDRFGDDIDGVGIVEETRIRANRLHIFYDAFRDMNGAQGHKETARCLRLLTNYAIFERNAFIQVTRPEAASAKAGQHSIAIAQPLTSIYG